MKLNVALPLPGEREKMAKKCQEEMALPPFLGQLLGFWGSLGVSTKS